MSIKQIKFSLTCWWFGREQMINTFDEIGKVNEIELVDFDYEEFRGCLKSRFLITITGTIQSINAFSKILKEVTE